MANKNEIIINSIYDIEKIKPKNYVNVSVLSDTIVNALLEKSKEIKCKLTQIQYKKFYFKDMRKIYRQKKIDQLNNQYVVSNDSQS